MVPGGVRDIIPDTDPYMNHLEGRLLEDSPPETKYDDIVTKLNSTHHLAKHLACANRPPKALTTTRTTALRTSAHSPP